MKVLLKILLLIITSCASPILKKEVVQIKSLPQAYVYLMVEGAQPIRLGVTPIDLSSEEIISKNNSSSLIRLKLSSPGFSDEWFLFDAKNRFGKIDFRLKPVEWWNDKTNVAPSRIAQQIGTSVRETYKLIRQGKNAEAKKDVERLQKQYPFASIFYDLLGSLSVLDNNNAQAIMYYEQSLKLSPSNKETSDILDKLKRGNR